MQNKGGCFFFSLTLFILCISIVSSGKAEKLAISRLEIRSGTSEGQVRGLSGPVTARNHPDREIRKRGQLHRSILSGRADVIAKPTIPQLLNQLMIEDYITFHQRFRLSAKRVILRFDTAHPGLGDRMGSLLNMLIMASFSNRIIVVDWKSPYPLSSFFFPSELPRLEYDQNVDYDPEAYHCRKNCLPFDLRPLLGEKKTVIYYGLPSAHLNVVQGIIQTFPGTKISMAVRPYLHQIPPSYNPYPRIFQVLLRPAPRLEKMMVASISGHMRRYVSVHARLGKGIGEIGPRFLSNYKISLGEVANCFCRAALSMRTSHENKRPAVFYLATDTKEFRPFFENAIKIHMPNSKVLHPKEGFTPVHTRICDPKISSDCINTVLEFMILAHGTAMISTPSSFSKVAALIGGLDEPKFVSTRECARSIRKNNI